MVREFAFSSTGSVSLRGFGAVGFAAIEGFTVVILIVVVVVALCRGLSFFTAMAFSDFAIVFEPICEAGREFLNSVGLAT
jgi:hypothetical protein